MTTELQSFLVLPGTTPEIRIRSTYADVVVRQVSGCDDIVFRSTMPALWKVDGNVLRDHKKRKVSVYGEDYHMINRLEVDLPAGYSGSLHADNFGGDLKLENLAALSGVFVTTCNKNRERVQTHVEMVVQATVVSIKAAGGATLCAHSIKTAELSVDARYGTVVHLHDVHAGRAQLRSPGARLQLNNFTGRTITFDQSDRAFHRGGYTVRVIGNCKGSATARASARTEIWLEGRYAGLHLTERDEGTVSRVRTDGSTIVFVNEFQGCDFVECPHCYSTLQLSGSRDEPARFRRRRMKRQEYYKLIYGDKVESQAQEAADGQWQYASQPSPNQ